MTVLCTGDLGFIGGHLRAELDRRGYETRGADIKRAERENINVLRASDLYGVDVIIHHAGQSSLAASRENPENDIYHNILGTVHLLQIAKEARVNHFIFASTSAVYDDVGDLYETTPLKPRIPYGITKLAAEYYIQQSGIPFTIFRYANVYGCGQLPVGESALIPHCLGHLVNGKPFAIHGTGEKCRDFVFVDDVVGANILAMEKRIFGIYNIGTEVSTSVNRICDWLANACGKPGYEFKHDSDKLGEAQVTRLMSAKFRMQAGWFPLGIIQDHLAVVAHDWIEKNKNGSKQGK